MRPVAQFLIMLLLAMSCPASVHTSEARLLTSAEVRALLDDANCSRPVEIAIPTIAVHVADPKLSVVATGVNESRHTRWFRVRVSGEPGIPDFIVSGPIGLRSTTLAREQKPTLPIAVHRGDRVRMMAESGNLRLTTVGFALENAKPGEGVRVRIAGSQHIVHATATASSVSRRTEKP